MGLRFRKSISLGKGVRINLGTSGASLSVGAKGARCSMHTSGRKTVSLGVPGTGLSYTKTLSNAKRNNSNKSYSYKKNQSILQSNNANYINDSSLQVEEYENYINTLRTVHQECYPNINWHELNTSSPPFSNTDIGPRESEAQNAYSHHKPSIIDNIFRGGGAKKKELLANIDIARAEDQSAYAEWNSLHALARGVLAGDTDAYLDVINVINPFEDLVEFGSDFEFGTDNKDIMEIEFCVKSDDVIPRESKTLTKTGKISTKELTKTNYYDYIQDYVCSCTIRLAREILAIIPVQSVIVHAVDNIINTATGNQEDITILSVRFERARFSNINFDAIDPSDFVKSFENNMSFMKTGGFKEVYRLS